MERFERVEGTGEAIIHKGDPREPGVEDIDVWWNSLLGSVQPATSRPHLYGSDAGLCARKNVFYSQNTWEPFVMQPSTRTYMAIGVALENMLRDSLKEKDLLIASNPYLISLPEVKVRGKIDLVIVDHQEDIALVEVKSCGELPYKPNVQHLAQIQTYSAISGIEKCYLTYISRKVQEQVTWGPNISIRTFLVDTTEEALTSRLTTVIFSDLCIKAASLPVVPLSFRKTEECRYCPFLHYCWKAEPRYGSTGPDSSTVRDLEIIEELDLLDRARTIATRLYKELDLRKKETLREFFVQEELSVKNLRFLNSLIEEI